MISTMVSFEDETRSNLDDLKDQELRAVRNSNDPPFKGGSDANDTYKPHQPAASIKPGKCHKHQPSSLAFDII
jgi:hypothetical protein